LLVGVLFVLPMLVPGSGARAQGRFSTGAPLVLQPRPITLQATQGLPQGSPTAMTPILIDPGPIGIDTTTNLFAQVAIGGGYTTVFTFLNTGDATVTGNLILTDDNGAPLNATLASPGLAPAAPNPDERFFASSTAVTVPPGGTQFITASPASPGDDLKAGWARVESSGGPLAGVATFQLVNGTALATIAGVFSAEATSAATIPVDDDGTPGFALGRFTGYAVANPENSSMNIKIVLVNPDGSISQTLSPQLLNPLLPGSHVARFLWQDLNNLNLKFQGSMVLIEQGGKKFSVVALVQNQGLFTAIPVLPTKAANIN